MIEKKKKICLPKTTAPRILKEFRPDIQISNSLKESHGHVDYGVKALADWSRSPYCPESKL